MKPSSPPDLSALAPLAPALASTIASLAGDIALVLDGDGVIRGVAEGAAPLSPETSQWVGRRWVETVTADTRAKIESLLDEVRDGGVARRREVNHPGPGGDSIPVAWSALRLGDSGALIALGRDLRAVAAIQQRFLDTQQELERAYWRRRQDETREQQLLQVAHDALFVLDAATLQVLAANDSALALVQHERAAFVGRALTELMAPAARAATAELLSGARSSGRAGEIRLRLSEREAPIGLAATPLRAHERQCLLVRARRDAAADGAADALDAIVVVDSAGRVQMANAAALRHLQAGAEVHLQGRVLAEFVPAGEAALWTALVERARREALVTRMPIEGAAGAIEVTAALLPEGEQECIGLVWRLPSEALRPRPANTEGLRALAAQLGRAPLPVLLARARREAERHLVSVALWRAGGSQAEAARLLGLAPEDLTRRLRRLGLPPAPGTVE